MVTMSTSCVVSSSEEELEYASECKPKVDLLEDSDITLRERLKICFRPRYDLRKVKNKGAILVLVWNFLVTSIFYYVSRLTPESYNYCNICFQLMFIPVGILLTVAGWLADIRFGRYNVIYWSSLIMWISAVFLVLSLILLQVLDLNYIQIFVLIFLGTLGIGYSGFQANIIQFGIDQLTVASTDEIISFVNWYAWAYVTSGVVSIFVSSCMSPLYSLIPPLLLCVCASVVVCLIMLCNHVLVKEPAINNPFKLIYQVTKYAMKTKHPQRRSAFTYCEDEMPSRLDFGKRKYGGPFTTEQVEDVKMFFKLLGIVIIIGGVFGMTDEKTFKLHSLVQPANNITSFRQCSLRYIFTETYYITVAILIPANELFIHPLFHRCLPRFGCFSRVFLGVVLHLGRYSVLVALEFVDRKYAYIFTIIQCPHHGDTVDSNIYMLSAIPEIVSAVSYIFILVGTIEVLCAQVPYSMKGVFVGIFYGSLILFLLINSGISQLFEIDPSAWNSKDIVSCRFWYLLIKVSFLLIVVIGYLFVIFCFKNFKRKREDILPNEQIFAERYYSK